MLENDVSAKVGRAVPASFLREPAVDMDCHAGCIKDFLLANQSNCSERRSYLLLN